MQIYKGMRRRVPGKNPGKSVFCGLAKKKITKFNKKREKLAIMTQK
jgi:hypothetical protein